ncbi:MAG: histidine--tRNA ligase, partial [Clostridia bacterium]|nr:histidine--tRNA ligase [Clostridia bacterium]
MINIPKGTKDVLPEESYRWQYLEGLARETAAVFGAREIRTPTFEATELFARGVGDTTDVVTKEMYTFTDKGGRSMTLKPEGTAGVCRSFIENGLASRPMPMKSYYFTPVFRYERPQAGRLREHHQFGVEYYGASSAVTDAEVILLAKTFLEKAGVTALALKINSIGCKTCRARFNAALKEFLAARLDQMCATCKERFDRNPLRIIDCKEQGCKELLVGAPQITDYLCEDCEAHFNVLKNTLTAAGVEYAVDPTIVRGLDYYT